MADEADLAADHIEKTLQAALSQKRTTLKPTGWCFYCNEQIKPNTLFCEAACRDDFEEEQRLKRLAGR